MHEKREGTGREVALDCDERRVSRPAGQAALARAWQWDEHLLPAVADGGRSGRRRAAIAPRAAGRPRRGLLARTACATRATWKGWLSTSADGSLDAGARRKPGANNGCSRRRRSILRREVSRKGSFLVCSAALGARPPGRLGTWPAAAAVRRCITDCWPGSEPDRRPFLRLFDPPEAKLRKIKYLRQQRGSADYRGRGAGGQTGNPPGSQC